MFEIHQREEYIGDDWWEWAVWIEGQTENLDMIKFVEWTLHPTFPNPVRKIDDRKNNFRLETGGWGVFPIYARIQMEDGSMMKLAHYLELHYPDGTLNTY